MRSLIFGLSFLLLFGCQRDDTIVAYQAPKDPPRAAMQGDEHSHESEVSWTLPDGWKQVPTGKMQHATFHAGDETVVASVIALPPNQAILPNINRWEGQLGLPHSSEAEASAKLKQLDIAGSRFAMLDLVGATQSIAVAFTEQPQHTWYFKMQGPNEKVATQLASFDAFVKSVRFQQPKPERAPTTAPTATAPQKSSVPSHWTAQPEKPMRFAGFKTSSDATSAEIVVTKLAPGFGTMLDNINRWRNMVGLPPLTSDSAAPPTQLTVGGTQADVYDFTGTQSPPMRNRVIMAPTADGQTIWFFRITGPADTVAKEQAAFDQFVQSSKLDAK